MKNLLILLLAAISLNAGAQADTTEKWFVGGDIYTGYGQIFQNGALGIRNGKIIYAGPKDGAPIKGNAASIQGKRIYPGLIAMNSILGLSEIEAVRATHDFAEVGENNAHVRSAIAYNTDSKIIPTVINNGVLTAQVCPRGGIISGQSSVMRLQARNWEEAAYTLDNGLHINWPEFTGDEKGDKKAAEQVQQITNWLKEAKSYSMQKTSETNLRYEALKKALAGQMKVFVHADGARSMVNAIQTLKTFKITPVIVGGTESHLITPILKENNIGVVIIRTQRLPGNIDDSYDDAYALPYMLWKDSVQFAIGELNFWEQRTLPFEAGQAVAFGLPQEEALKAVTLYPAQLLGIDKTIGSLEAGKDATFIITTGDILDMRGSVVEQAYYQGQPIDLTDPQKQLYEKFKKIVLEKKGK